MYTVYKYYTGYFWNYDITRKEVIPHVKVSWKYRMKFAHICLFHSIWLVAVTFTHFYEYQSGFSIIVTNIVTFNDLFNLIVYKLLKMSLYHR